MGLCTGLSSVFWASPVVLTGAHVSARYSSVGHTVLVWVGPGLAQEPGSTVGPSKLPICWSHMGVCVNFLSVSSVCW